MDTKRPDISKEVENLIFEKLNLFNQGKTAEKGCYYILTPNSKTIYYTLRFYDSSANYHTSIYILNLELDAISSVSKAIQLVANSYFPLYLTEQTDPIDTNGDDIISFGKYRGHHLHEIYTIDPHYVCWIADKYEAHTKNELHFKEMATLYNRVYIDLHTFKKYKKDTSRFIGIPGEKITDLSLTITKMRIEDDPYKTKVINGRECFYVDQLITAVDQAGNMVLYADKAKSSSLTSRTLSSSAHVYKTGEEIRIVSAKVLRHIESHNIKYTKIGYIKY